MLLPLSPVGPATAVFRVETLAAKALAKQFWGARDQRSTTRRIAAYLNRARRLQCVDLIMIDHGIQEGFPRWSRANLARRLLS
jgi:hypothetical protein